METGEVGCDKKEMVSYYKRIVIIRD